MTRWWPLIGLAAMLLLGVLVGPSSTRVDDWFQRFGDTPARRLTVLADPRLLLAVTVAVLAVACLQRRWWLALMTVLAPLAGIAFVRVLKPVFAREKGDGLAYPSGHITATTVVIHAQIAYFHSGASTTAAPTASPGHARRARREGAAQRP